MCWRNVEASCHKHFVVFSRNQHRRLPPAMCQTRETVAVVHRRPRLQHLLVAALTQAVKPESWFLPTPPAFDSPVRRVPVRILLCRLARKN